MASSENHGLQISLVIFIILTLVLSITTFIYFKQAQDMILKEQAARQRSEQDAKSLSTALDELTAVKEILGFEKTDTPDMIRQTSNTELEEWAPGYLGKEMDKHKTYRTRLKYVATSLLAEKDRNLLAQQQMDKDYIDKYKVLQSQAVASVEQEKKVAVAAVEQSKSAINTFSGKVNEITASEQRNKGEVQRIQTEANTKVDEAGKKVADLENQISGVEKENRELIDRVEKQQVTDFTIPAGEIVRVDPLRQVVWINLGSEDRLPRKVTFSVHSPENHRLDSHKAKIEVTRIILPHLSEAKILEANSDNPLVEGDHIFSPAWSKGQAVRFALTGWMDIDGDGQSDRELVKRLILNSRGLVDAEVRENGAYTGEITIDTRYLVRGSDPRLTAAEAKDAGNEKARVLENHGKMVEAAKKFKVETINLSEFLDLMGYANVRPVTRLGGEGSIEDFRPEPQDGELVRKPLSEGVLNKAFRERRPPKAGEPAAKKSAY